MKKISEIENSIEKLNTNTRTLNTNLNSVYAEIRKQESEAVKIKRHIDRNKLQIVKLNKQMTENVYSEDRYQVGFKIQIPESNGYYKHMHFESINRRVEGKSYIEILKRTPKMFKCKLNVSTSINRWIRSDTFTTIERRFSFRVFSRFLKELHGDEWISDLHTTKRDESIQELIES